MNEAYKKRDLDAMKIRLKNHARFDKFQTKLKQKKNYHIDKTTKKQFIVYPCITSLEVLADIINRLSFALPQKDNLNIFITVSNTLETINIHELSIPEFQEPYIGRNKNIFLINETKAKEYLQDIFSIILLHDTSVLKEFSILKQAHKLEIIDKEYFSDKEAETLRRLYFSILSTEEKNRLLNISKENFQTMKEKNRGKKKAYCFTTGPSFDQYREFDFERDSFKVICNSIAKNDAFLSYINGADLILFADPVFHFGPSSYAEQFRQDILKLVDKYDTYVLIPNHNMPLLLAHYPQLEKKLIGMPTKKDFNFPSNENFFVKGSANILTLFMLPIASSISKTIGILGADGRKDNEKYFWKHSSSAQYDDKMESVFNSHPSFFRDRDYKDYYLEHCNFLRQLINYGESKGKIYYSMTPSHIPILKERYALQPLSIYVIKSKNFIKNIYLNLLKRKLKT